MSGSVMVVPPTGDGVEITDETPLASQQVVWGMAGAQFGLFVALLAPVFVSLALKAQTIVPVNEAPAVTGNILTGAAFFALFANPIFGRLSDMTTSRFGRRRPWMLAGGAVFVAALYIMAEATSVSVLFAGWCLAQIGGNAILAPLLTTIADQIPSRQRASVAANVGVMQNLGILAASYIASWFVHNMLVLFVLPGLFAFVMIALYCVVLPDTPIKERPASAGVMEAVRTFWVNPRKHPDFAWAWISRFLMILSIFLFISFRLFFMQSELKLDTQAAVDTIATGVLINTIALVIFAKLGGWLSDRSGKRKIYVFLSTALYGIGTALLAFTTDVWEFYLVEAIMGAAAGIYTAVDMALVIEVLPSKEDAAKDLGVFNIANVLPQSLAGAFGALLLAVGTTNSDNYMLLFAVGGLVGVLGALTIIPVRGAR